MGGESLLKDKVVLADLTAVKSAARGDGDVVCFVPKSASSHPKKCTPPFQNSSTARSSAPTVGVCDACECCRASWYIRAVAISRISHFPKCNGNSVTPNLLQTWRVAAGHQGRLPDGHRVSKQRPFYAASGTWLSSPITPVSLTAAPTMISPDYLCHHCRRSA